MHARTCTGLQHSQTRAHTRIGTDSLHAHANHAQFPTSRSLPHRDKDKAVKRLETQLLEMEQTLQSLSDSQVGLLADEQQAKVEHRWQFVAHFLAVAHKRRAISIRENAFGCWAGIVKHKVEATMVEAMELLQTQVAAFEEELLDSKGKIQGYEQKLEALQSVAEGDTSQKKQSGSQEAIDLSPLDTCDQPPREGHDALLSQARARCSELEAERASLQNEVASRLQQYGELQGKLLQVQEITSARQRQVNTNDRSPQHIVSECSAAAR